MQVILKLRGNGKEFRLEHVNYTYQEEERHCTGARPCRVLRIRIKLWLCSALIL